MKKLRFLFLGLLMMATVCGAQEITEPGWFNSTGWVAPVEATATNSPPGDGGTAGRGTSSSDIADAITPEIAALARGLENDPKRIFDFVHDHIRHVFYFGSKKGAQLTLLERSGNDFDQCALLVALLRAAGQTELSYQFGLLKMPYDSSDHNDLHHWLGLSLVNTNWSNTANYFGYLLGTRGYPESAFFTFGGDTNTLAFHRVWVKLMIGATTNYLDPAFKVSEPVTGINLSSAMGLNTNDLMTAAAGTSTADYVQNLSEAALRNKLRDYTTNLLGSLQSNYPNASVEQILGGQQIIPSTNTALSQSLLFPTYNHGGQLPVVSWDTPPTNLMAQLTISFAGTNKQWFIPELQGQRLSLTYSNTGLAQLWLEDTNILQKSTTSADTNVTLSINHPHGRWDITNNTLIDTARTDHSATVAYQRTSASYALVYAFEAGEDALRRRQQKLDAYRQQGLADSSRQVVTETLNVMGLNWLRQAALTESAVASQRDVLQQSHHRFGRMAQESGKGYYLDVYLNRDGIVTASGTGFDDHRSAKEAFDVGAYLASALEHGMIEQMQSSSLVAASTVKMLSLSSTNTTRKVFQANSSNWTTGANIRSQLTNYGLSGLDSNINAGFTLLLPQDGLINVAGAGSWTGFGIAARLDTTNYWQTTMLIAGGYSGGFVEDEDATPDPSFIFQFGYEQQQYLDPSAPFMFNLYYGADPVSMADGSFTLNETDLTFGQSEPRGITFARHYGATRRHHNLAGMAHGWVNNYYFNLAEVSGPLLGLGQTTPAQMAPMLVATRAALELYSTNGNPKNWAVTSLIAKWGVDQLINNSVSITMGKDTMQFVKQPDGSFTPPANCTMTLTKTNTAYTLHERNGNAFKFDSNKRLTNIVDQYSQGLKLTYGTGASSNLVATVTDWKNRTLTLAYTGSPLRLTSVSNSTGVAVSYGYTTNGGQLDLTSVTDPEQKTHTFIYDTNHQIIATKDALSQIVVSNIYDGFGRVTTQYSQGDTNQAWQLFWSGFVNVEQDPTGSKRRFFYDDKTRPIALQDALGNVSQTLYDGQDHAVMTVSPLNETNRFEFDGRHNLLRSVDPLNYTNNFVYDTQDRLTRTVDARGSTNQFGYNAKHQLTASTNGAGDWVTLTYNSTDGTLTTRVDPGGSTSNSYDSFGQLSGVTYPGSLGTESYLNNARGDVTNRTNARGFVTSFQYNLRRQLTNTIAPTNLTAKVAYDAVGNVQSRTDARGFTTTSYWSATRKPTGTVLPNAAATTNFYDARDWLSRTLNPLQQATVLTNDAAGRLSSATDPLSRTTKSSYDAVGRQTGITNAALEVTKQQWNARGELTKLTDPTNHTVLRSYDEAGNPVTLTNRNGKKWQFQFDASNRLTNTITPLNRETRLTFDARGLLSTLREPSTQTTTNFYDPRGRLTNRADQVAATTYRYDANNNVTNIVEAGKTNAWTLDAYDRVSTYKDADGNLIQYRYDANGNVTNLIYPGNKTVTYIYDSLNRLTNVTDWASRQTSFEYDLASRVKKITRPNGTLREIGYDAAGQTTNIVERLNNNAPVAFFKFRWDAAGRMTNEFAAPLPFSNAPPSRTMDYDDDNRLKTFRLGFGSTQTVTNDLDGNLIWGPLTNDTLVAYTYDARNRLLNVGGVTNAYDPAGNRVGVTNGTNVVRFVINPNAALSQMLMRVKNGVTNYYVYGLGLLYEADDAGNTKTYHYDYRGSTIAITDGNGWITDRVNYSAYGSITYRSGTNDTPFLYNGRYGVQTDANGLLHMRARYYNPYLCRFINADPAGFSGGLNFYAYAGGNPVSMLDPFGLGTMEAGPDWLDTGVGYVGATMDAVSSMLVSLFTPQPYPGAPLTLAEQQIYAGIAANAQQQFGTPFRDDGAYEPGSGTELAGQVTAYGLALWLGVRGAAAGEAGLAAKGTMAVSPYRMTTAGETFSHYGYAENAAGFQGGLRPGGFATSVGDLSGAGAQSGLALPRSVPPNAVYTVTPEAGTWIRANPITRPQFGQPGGLPEYQFPGGTGPGTVSPPRPIP